MGVLQLVGFDVLPEGLDDAGAGLSVDAQQASQPGVQLELGGLRRPSNGVRKRISQASAWCEHSDGTCVPGSPASAAECSAR